MKKKFFRAVIFTVLMIAAVIFGKAMGWLAPAKEQEASMPQSTTLSESAASYSPISSEMSESSETSPQLTATPIATGKTATPSHGATKSQQNGKAFQLNIKGKVISVAYGVDETTLDKTPGWLTTSASPGQDGMCVVYGHRNRTHLRVLEQVERGDKIVVTLPDSLVYTYIVTDIQIYENTEDLRLSVKDGKTLALVTCYPFRYSGNAPGKFAVYAQINRRRE